MKKIKSNIVELLRNNKFNNEIIIRNIGSAIFIWFGTLIFNYYSNKTNVINNFYIFYNQTDQTNLFSLQIALLQIQSTISVLVISFFIYLCSISSYKMLGKSIIDLMLMNKIKLIDYILLSIMLIPINYINLSFKLYNAMLFIFFISIVLVILILLQITSILSNSYIIVNKIKRIFEKEIEDLNLNRNDECISINNLCDYTIELINSNKINEATYNVYFLISLSKSYNSKNIKNIIRSSTYLYEKIALCVSKLIISSNINNLINICEKLSIEIYNIQDIYLFEQSIHSINKVMSEFNNINDFYFYEVSKKYLKLLKIYYNEYKKVDPESKIIDYSTIENLSSIILQVLSNDTINNSYKCSIVYRFFEDCIELLQEQPYIVIFQKSKIEILKTLLYKEQINYFFMTFKSCLLLRKQETNCEHKKVVFLMLIYIYYMYSYSKTISNENMVKICDEMHKYNLVGGIEQKPILKEFIFQINTIQLSDLKEYYDYCYNYLRYDFSILGCCKNNIINEVLAFSIKYNNLVWPTYEEKILVDNNVIFNNYFNYDMSLKDEHKIKYEKFLELLE